MAIAIVTPLFRLPDQLRIDFQDAPVVPATTPAAREFALLETWLASRVALQLPLHQIEAQQQTKGREVQRLLLQAHLQRRGHGDMDLPYASNTRAAKCCTPIVGSAPVP